MRYKRKIFLDSKKRMGKKVLKLIKDTDIEYEIMDNGTLLFDIYEDHSVWNELKELLKDKLLSVVEVEYAKEELDEASWLCVRSRWHNGYPMPDEDNFTYEHVVYGVNKGDCHCNKKQIGEFDIKQDPQWGARFFFMLNWVSDELFVNASIQEGLRNSGLKGFSFKNVNLYRKETISSQVQQLYVKEELVDTIDSQNTEHSKLYNCNHCGTEKIVLTGRNYYYKAQAFKNVDVDIIKSKSVFGDGGGSREIYISHKFYQYLINNKLNRNLVFTPINLI